MISIRLNNVEQLPKKWFVDNKQQKKKKKKTHSHKFTQYLSSYEWTQDGIRQWKTHLPEIINQLMSMANVLTDKWHRCTNHYDTFHVRFHWAIMGTNQNVLNIETVEHYHPNCHSEMFINFLFSYLHQLCHWSNHKSWEHRFRSINYVPNSKSSPKDIITITVIHHCNEMDITTSLIRQFILQN